MGKREKLVEDYLVKSVIDRGGFARKYTSPGRRGVPDRILFLPKNLVMFIEVKTINGTLSTTQKREMERIQALDIPCGVVTSMLDVDHLMLRIDGYLNETS